MNISDITTGMIVYAIVVLMFIAGIFTFVLEYLLPMIQKLFAKKVEYTPSRVNKLKEEQLKQIEKLQEEAN
jgi:type II secretory pathway component PulF